MQQSNAQREIQLLTEWWATMPRGWPNKTNVNVGASKLFYLGQPLSPARQRAFGVWNDKADMRIFTGLEVWIIEAKIVNTGSAYGQVLDYLDEYPASDDYQQFNGAPVVGVVICAFERLRTTARFERLGIRTIVFTPSWAGNTLAEKVFNGVGNVASV